MLVLACSIASIWRHLNDLRAAFEGCNCVKALAGCVCGHVVGKSNKRGVCDSGLSFRNCKANPSLKTCSPKAIASAEMCHARSHFHARERGHKLRVIKACARTMKSRDGCCSACTCTSELLSREGSFHSVQARQADRNDQLECASSLLKSLNVLLPQMKRQTLSAGRSLFVHCLTTDSKRA